MEVLKLTEYETAEGHRGGEFSPGAKTKTGVFKHNESIGLLTGALVPGQAGTAGTAPARRQAIYI